MSHGVGEASPARVRFGEIWIDAVDMDGALAAIERLVDRRAGGAVFTPNVDHIVVADRLSSFREAYARADLVLCDGVPLLWCSGLLGVQLPAKVSGSDLFLPLMGLAARRSLRVYLLGGGDGVAKEAARRLQEEHGVAIAGWSCPRIGLTGAPEEEEIVAGMAAARPDILLVCLGTPKGELFVDRVRDRLRPAVAFSMGASLDFYVGRVRRAPRWMQRMGLEWLFRLLQEPQRLARRYLVEDLRFLAILLQTLLRRRIQRVREPRP